MVQLSLSEIRYQLNENSKLIREAILSGYDTSLVNSLQEDQDFLLRVLNYYKQQESK